MPELMDDVKTLRPNVFMTAPRVLTRLEVTPGEYGMDR